MSDTARKIGMALGGLVGLLVVLAVLMCINVYRASQASVAHEPDQFEIGRQKLHQQLEEARQREAQFEKQDWNSGALLRGLISAHQHRIDELAGNSQAGEIIAYDHDAITRLQNRINQLAEIQAEEPDTDTDAPAQPNPAPQTQN